MTDEEKQENQQPLPEGDSPKEAPTDNASSKKGLLKYFLFGAGGLVLVAVVVLGAMIFFGEDDPEAETTDGFEYTTTTDEEDGEESHPSKEADNDSDVNNAAAAEIQTETQTAMETSIEDSILASLEDESDVFDEIMKNLEYLDYDPTSEELGEDIEPVLSSEDSIEQVNWLESEKTRLAEWETKLDARKRELDITDKKVSQKLLKIEQAESAKISNLAKLYDGMDPRAIAKVMANLDDATVVSILPRMKLKNASAVLSLMPAKRGARLSKKMITIAGK
jgi:flagellar motility protein MotE (MotC chaperone)